MEVGATGRSWIGRRWRRRGSSTVTTTCGGRPVGDAMGGQDDAWSHAERLLAMSGAASRLRMPVKLGHAQPLLRVQTRAACVGKRDFLGTSAKTHCGLHHYDSDHDCHDYDFGAGRGGGALCWRRPPLRERRQGSGGLGGGGSAAWMVATRTWRASRRTSTR